MGWCVSVVVHPMPCLFCANNESELLNEHDFAESREDCDSWAMLCGICGARGPMSPRELAVHRWNDVWKRQEVLVDYAQKMQEVRGPV